MNSRNLSPVFRMALERMKLETVRLQRGIETSSSLMLVKGQQLTAIDLDFGSRTTYSARTEKEREEKIGPFLKLCLVRMHAFAL